MKRRIRNIFFSLIAIVMCFFLVSCSGEIAVARIDGNSFIESSLNSGGSAEVGVFVSYEKATGYGVGNLSDFKIFFDGYVEVLNGSSEDVDVIKIKEYSEIEGGYSVKLETRRVDRIGGLGTIDYRVGSTFATFEQQMEKIELYYDGVSDKITKTVYPLDQEKTQFTYRIQKRDNDFEIAARKYQGNGLQTVNYSEFYNYLKGTKDKIISFKLAGLILVDSITIKLDGELKYASSGCVQVIDNNTIKLTPKTLVTDEGSTVNVFMGYITYSPHLSTFVTVLIIIGCVALGVLLFFTIKFKWLSRFFHSKIFASMKKHKMLYLMLIPGLALLILFHYLPLKGLITAFQRYDIFDGYNSEIIGFKNFANIFNAATSDKMYTIFRNTIFISLIRIATNFPIILITALIVQSIKRRRVKAVYQAISFIPYFISWAAVGGMAYALLSTNNGLINEILIKLGKDPVKWYSTPEAWWWILATTSLWKGMGWGTLIYIAAMCNIDNSLYEACSLDGGGVISRAIHVTLPSIMNVVCLQLILDAGNIMKDNYEQILALVPGDTSALNSSIEVIGKYTFSQLNGVGMGAATAMGLIQSIIGLLLVLFVNNIVRKTENEGVI